MKQKNLILLVVAVGCGLLAAFLTTQMTGKTAVVEQADVFVAAKNVKVGDKITKENFSELITLKKMNKIDAPIDGVTSQEELIGKEFNRALRPGDAIRITDCGKYVVVTPPPGKHLYTIKLPYEAVVGPFVQPGSKVDVVCTHRPPGSNEVRHIQLLPDMLIIAVDLKAEKTGERGQPVLNTLTLAASLNESKWLQTAQDCGAQLRFLVRDESSETFTKLPDEELVALFNKPTVTAADLNKNDGNKDKPGTEAPGTAAATEKPLPPVKIPVAMKDIKAGQLIDDEFIANVMLKQPFAAPAPTDAILDLTAHKGRRIIQDVLAKNFLTENMLGDKVTETVKAPETKVETPKAVEPKKPFKTWDTTLTTGSGIKKFRYVMWDANGDWVLQGEVHEDGSVSAAPMPNLQKDPAKTEKESSEGGKISQP